MLRNIKVLRNVAHKKCWRMLEFYATLHTRKYSDNLAYPVISATLKEVSSHFGHPKKKYPSLSESLKKCATYPCKTLLNNLEVNDIIDLEQIEQYRTDN